MKTFSALAVAFSFLLSSAAQADYQTEVVAEGLQFPWSMDFLPDGSILLTEREGRLRLIDPDGNLQQEPIEELPEIWVDGQAGLFEVRLSPDFAETQHIFISYACGTARANTTCLSRARFTEHQLQDIEEIFRATPDRAGSAHYGGRIEFLPDDTLLLTLGDGFDYREQAQKPENHIGSIVRLNLDGSVPNDNPLIRLSRAAPETYSYGHRNVQGIVYDKENERLYTNEHGPKGGDELNLMTTGANYGWPLLTGGVDYNNARITPFTELPGMTDPLLEWTPSIAPSGMTLYRGEQFPHWDGDLFVSALAARKVERVRLSGDRVVEQETLFSDMNKRIRYVYTGPDGALYLLTDEEKGQLIRITASEE